MDPSSSTKKSTDPCSSEIPDCYTCPDSILKDEFPSSGKVLTDTVVPEMPWSESQSLADEVVPERPLADEVVPETVLGDVFVPTLTTSKYKAFLEEYEERIAWYSKNKFDGQNHYKWDRSSSSPTGDSSLNSDYDCSYSVYQPSSQESDADNPRK